MHFFLFWHLFLATYQRGNHEFPSLLSTHIIYSCILLLSTLLSPSFSYTTSLNILHGTFLLHRQHLPGLYIQVISPNHCMLLSLTASTNLQFINIKVSMLCGVEVWLEALWFFTMFIIIISLYKSTATQRPLPTFSTHLNQLPIYSWLLQQNFLSHLFI